MTLTKFPALLCVAMLGVPGFALAQQGKVEPMPPAAAAKPLPELKGVMSWKMLAEVQTVKQRFMLTPMPQ